MLKLGREPTDSQSLLEESARLYRRTFFFSFLYSFTIACFLTIPFFFILSFHHYFTMGILSSLGLLIFIFTQALLYHVYCYCSNVPCNLAIAFKQVLMKFPALIFLMVAYTIIVLGGAVLLIIPGIIFAISLMFSFILVLTDNKKISQALMTSHQLVWPYWRHTFFTIMTPLLLNIVISLAFFIAIIEWGTLVKLSMKNIILSLACANVLVQSFFIPYIINVTIVLLNDLRLRRTLASPPWN